MSKVIRICFGFAILCSVIGLKTLRHYLDQSKAKLKPIVTRSRTFSRALCRGCMYCFKFTTVKRKKRLYFQLPVGFVSIDSKIRKAIQEHKFFQLTLSPINVFFSIPTTKEDSPFSSIFTGNFLASDVGQLIVLTLIASSVIGTRM